MRIVFITGGIGSGKSAACRILSEYGIPVYDSDSRTKVLYDTDPDLLSTLEKALECGSLRNEKGSLDKQKLSSIIFSDKAKLATLESIVHPAVLKDFLRWAKECESTLSPVPPFVVMESALVLQKPLFDGVADLVVLVDAPVETRVKRAISRDSSNEQAIRNRVNNQILDRSKADVAIDNDSDLDSLKKEVIEKVLNYSFETERVNKDTANTGNTYIDNPNTNINSQLSKMNYKPFKDITLSRLAMGNMRLPQKGEGFNAPIDWEESAKIIDYAIKHGVNYFDTAWIYNSGESERFLGETLTKYPRDSYYIATKFNIDATTDYKYVFEEQLRRLQTDHIDFYLIHGLSDGNCQKYIDSGAIEYLLEQKEKGRITYFGFSCHASVENLERFADLNKWDFAQLQINYFDWKYSNTKKEYEILSSRNIPIMVMEPVRGGRLAALTPETDAILKGVHPDWSIASWALRFVQTLPGVQTVLSGMSSMAQIEDNVKTFSGEEGLSQEEMDILMDVCEKFNGQIRIPCTGCRYCCEDCPMQINIPAYLKLFNDFKVGGPFVLRFAGNIPSDGKPADCIGCGNCTSHCPQSIPVPEHMAELGKLLP